MQTPVGFPGNFSVSWIISRYIAYYYRKQFTVGEQQFKRPVGLTWSSCRIL
jgi:hypothetical protein